MCGVLTCVPDLDQLNHILNVVGSPSQEDLDCIVNEKVCVTVDNSSILTVPWISLRPSATFRPFLSNPPSHGADSSLKQTIKVLSLKKHALPIYVPLAVLPYMIGQYLTALLTLLLHKHWIYWTRC